MLFKFNGEQNAEIQEKINTVDPKDEYVVALIETYPYGQQLDAILNAFAPKGYAPCAITPFKNVKGDRSMVVTLKK